MNRDAIGRDILIAFCQIIVKVLYSVQGWVQEMWDSHGSTFSRGYTGLLCIDYIVANEYEVSQVCWDVDIHLLCSSVQGGLRKSMRAKECRMGKAEGAMLRECDVGREADRMGWLGTEKAPRE